MLSSHTLRDRPGDFFAATGVTLEAVEQLFPAFQTPYAQLYPPDSQLSMGNSYV
jgi:hypothetical protein